MTQFLNLDWQTLINADAIERIKDAPAQGRPCAGRAAQWRSAGN